MEESILIRGARVHNLKNVSLAIPHNQLTVVTGVSGSGKSSLVFDTMYAEGQRRYVESLSAYARQFLERMEKPDVDEIDGIAPPIAIRQKNTTRNPRSTVATSTEMLRFSAPAVCARGADVLPEVRRRVERDTVDQVAAKMLAAAGGSRWYALFPVTHAEKPDTRRLRDHLFDLRKKGFNRLYQDGRDVRVFHARIVAGYRFREAAVRPGRSHCDSRPDLHQRIVDTIEICYREAGEVIFENAASPARRCASARSSRASAAAIEFRRTGAGAVQLQQSVRRVPALPGLRQHHRLRHGPGDSGSRSCRRRRRGRSVDQAASTTEWSGRAAGQITRGKVRIECAVRRSDGAEEQELVRRRRRSAGSSAKWKRRKYKVHVRVFLSRYRGYTTCPGLRRIATARGSAVRARRRQESSPKCRSMNIAEAHEFFRCAGADTGRNGHRRQDSGRDPAAIEVSERRRARVSDARSAVGHAFGRGSAAHSTRDVPGIAAGGRVLRAGRAVDRAAHRAIRRG